MGWLPRAAANRGGLRGFDLLGGGSTAAWPGDALTGCADATPSLRAGPAGGRKDR